MRPWLAALALCASSTIVRADDDSDSDISTSAESDLPSWASKNSLHLQISTQGGRQHVPQQYTVIPLSQGVGVNNSKAVQINGNLVAVNPSNYNTINGSDSVVYLSCDEPEGDGYVSQDDMLSAVAGKSLTAIILYSTSRNWCSLSDHGVQSDSKILSMVDPGDSQSVLSYLNGTSSGAIVKASIDGTSSDDDGLVNIGPGGGSNVAMSVLYAITGLIVLIFIYIVASGAIRAHRYPERYGPRTATGAQTRQSRAKGLARAMLETIPIVKFGNQPARKPDPDLEMDAATTDHVEAPPQTAARDQQQQQQRSSAEVAGNAESSETQPVETPATATASTGTNVAAKAGPASAVDEGPTPATAPGSLGCSICTEDFTLGEDVRVLPCSHQYHPACIDPWLVDVSGTCPLCRLDLRPGEHEATKAASAASQQASELPPPLAEQGEAAVGGHGRSRLSRFFDINRLRQASREEQMAALRSIRQHRRRPSQAQSQTTQPQTQPPEAETQAPQPPQSQ